MSRHIATQGGGKASAPFQFGLFALFGLVTLCALLAWFIATFGFVSVLAAAIGLSTGALAGGLVGLPFGSSRRSAAVGTWASLASLIICLVWWVSVLLYNAVQNKMPFPPRMPVQMPVHLFFEAHVVFFITGVALLGSVPAAAIATVHNRPGEFVVLYSAFVCAIAATLAGLTFFAYDVWCRGGFPRPPIPWPIALAIPLVAGSLAAAGIGTITGLIWLGIRSALNRLKTKLASKETSE